jgi:hypothetical protein
MVAVGSGTRVGVGEASTETVGACVAPVAGSAGEVGEAGLAVAGAGAVGEPGSGVGDELGVSLANLTGWQAARSSTPPVSRDSMLRFAIFISITSWLPLFVVFFDTVKKTGLLFRKFILPGSLIVRKKQQFGCYELYFKARFSRQQGVERTAWQKSWPTRPPHASLRWQLTAVCRLTTPNRFFI